MKTGTERMEDGIMKKSLLFAAALLALAACTREMAVNAPEGDLTLIAKAENPAGTRTVLEGGTFVFWEPGDEIAVSAGGKSGRFVGDLTATEASATFKGSLGEEAWTEGMDLWAVYPYSGDAVFDGGTITTVLPSEQTARAGSFGKGMNLSVAHSTTSTLQFYNVGGGVRFTLSQDGITEVVFKGLNGEILAGKVKVGFQDGVPTILDVTEGKTSVTLTPPEGETFKKDAWYYIVTLPGALEQGFTFSFRKTGNPAPVMPSCAYPKPVTVKRGTYGVLTHVDKGMGQTVSDEVIAFQDPLVKSIVVKYFDTSSDGELSYHEAAVVLSFLVDEAQTRGTDGLVSVFAGTGITTFDELACFTGLTRIEDGAFAGCTELTSITIPKNIESIGDNAFKGCTSLESIKATSETPPVIGNDAFADTGDCPILVPEGAVEAYVAAWGEYEERIRPNAYPEPEIVDLGLPSGVKWASFNLGASSPEEVGDYFAWGETEPYYSSLDPLTWKEGKEAGYDWPSYQWCTGTSPNITFTKYTYFGEFRDYKQVLDPEDDAAAVHLGGLWRMPTAAEFKEMLEKCMHEQVSVSGMTGWKITGPNGNSIFLPAMTGWWMGQELRYTDTEGEYWSSTHFSNATHAYAILLSPSNNSWIFYGNFRSSGIPVRPVHGEPGIAIERITLDQTELTLGVGESATLTATILPENATFQEVSWRSGNERIATVSPDGVVKAVSSGTTWIQAESFDPTRRVECNVTVTYSVPEAVDLGLPVKWASFNLGAAVPEGAGSFYGWGEVEPKLNYTWTLYPFAQRSQFLLTKYCTDANYGNEGFTDGKTLLDPEDDAATVNLGGKWRMPTDVEWVALTSSTNFDWVWDDTQKGYTVTSKIPGYEGKSIFLPAAGYCRNVTLYSEDSCGLYWASSLYVRDPRYAQGMYFDPSYIIGAYYDTRFSGFSIRPVYGDRPVTTGGDIEGTEEEPWN
ncbi:MAG: leucine-rich repeat protein [Bacteroidales bacterium]|nr:leucine-rich repeat protein [Bacteroidales bacterium]